MQRAWDNILEATRQLVMPDWHDIVATLPYGVAVVIVLVLGWLAIRAVGAIAEERATIAEEDAGAAQPASVEGIAEGASGAGSSTVPLLAAIGIATVVFGLALGPAVLVAGLVVVSVAVLSWGFAEARERGMEAGLLSSIAGAVALYGLVFGGWLLTMGLIMLFASLLGWLRDARIEGAAAAVTGSVGRAGGAVSTSAQTGRAGSTRAATGLSALPPGSIAFFGLLFVVGVVMNGGGLTPSMADASGMGVTGAAGGGGALGPTTPVAGAGQGAATAAPGQTGPLIPAADITITAQNMAFEPTTVIVPAGRPFTIAFVNLDDGVPHNVTIYRDSPTGPELFRGETFSGIGARLYHVPALPAGTHAFVCTIHPTMMVGTMTAQ